MYCEITTPKSIFKLDIVRNVTVIQGHSGSGKTYLCESIARGEKAGTFIKCEMPVESIYPVDVDYDKWFIEHRDSILFIDETVIHKATNEFCMKALAHGCRLVLCTRHVPKNIEYAVKAVLVLHRSGKYVTAKEKYILNKPHNANYPLIVEDSGSGLHFYKAIRGDTTTANGKDNIVTLITRDKLFRKTYIVDGAVFGQNIHSVWLEYSRGNIDIVAEESIEYVLLHAPMLYHITKDVLNNPEKYGASSKDYYSWERFFTSYLKEIMCNSGGYSKSGKVLCFINDCCYKNTPCDYVKYSCKDKLIKTLDNANLGWLVRSVADVTKLKNLLPPSVVKDLTDEEILNNFSYLLM